jgi:hypothetical protein
LPLAGAARLGEGRIVAVGHEGLLSVAGETPGNSKWAVNVVRWAAGVEQPRVAVQGHGNLAPALSDAGIEVTELAPADLAEVLPAAQVVVLGAASIGEDHLPMLREYVQSGGGLVATLCPWGWMQVTGGDLQRDLPANRLLAEAGLAFAPGMTGGTGPSGYLTDRSNLELCHAGEALEAIEAHARGDTELAPGELAQVSTVLATFMRGVPEGESALMPRFRALCATPEAECTPTPDEPVGSDRPLARLAATLYMQDTADLPAEDVEAHASAAAFPGAAPEDAPRVTEALSIDTSVPDWHSTGLYAPAGEVIEVRVPEAWAGRGLQVRIGCHTDGIWHHDQWRRFPEISRTYRLDEPISRVASPFGGLIYVVVPRGQDGAELDVQIDGAVRAPLYRHGVTDPAEWAETIRHAPAPWGEIVTDKVVIAAPSTALRDLEDPARLASFWDDVMDACADLAAIPRERSRPERYVPDVQISAGYMHSGYPIMTHLDAVDLSLDVDRLMTDGSWGHFHEMGHNHQSGHWTFGGTTEVTVNLFSLYIGETVCDLAGPGHEAASSDAARQRLEEYLANGASFDQWKSSPFLALIMYQQLVEEFGWETVMDVFAEYRAATPNELPRSDDEKRDQWMVRFSRHVGRNLGPFFDAWGVPVSDQAKDEIAELEPWMPADWPQT